MQTLMKPLNQSIRRKENRLQRLEKSIEKKTRTINKLKETYPYKNGRPPKDDKKAKDNITDRHKLKRERSELYAKISKVQS